MKGKAADELPHGGRDDGPGPTRDPPESGGRQLPPDDNHRTEDQDRHAGIYDELQHGTPYVRGPGDPEMSGKPSAQTVLHTVHAGLFLSEQEGEFKCLPPPLAAIGSALRSATRQPHLSMRRNSANLLRPHRPRFELPWYSWRVSRHNLDSSNTCCKNAHAARYTSSCRR